MSIFNYGRLELFSCQIEMRNSFHVATNCVPGFYEPPESVEVNATTEMHLSCDILNECIDILTVQVICYLVTWLLKMNATMYCKTSNIHQGAE